MASMRSVQSVDLVTILVDDYDDAIGWFRDVLGFTLVENRTSSTTDGRPKRWVVVRPAAGATGFVLAVADSAPQRDALGRQTGDRVSFFLRVGDFEHRLAVMRAAGVDVLGEPRAEAYGTVVVFRDPFGNRWDLLGPPTDH